LCGLGGNFFEPTIIGGVTGQVVAKPCDKA
jgi:hypothetical protein